MWTMPFRLGALVIFLLTSPRILAAQINCPGLQDKTLEETYREGLARELDIPRNRTAPIEPIDMYRKIVREAHDLEAYAILHYGEARTEFDRRLGGNRVIPKKSSARNDEVRSFLGRLKELNYQDLIVDPGIFQYRHEFEKYVASRKKFPTDPWQFRREFARKLGQETFYRAMWLTPAEQRFIETHGLIAGGLRQDIGLYKQPYSITRNYMQLMLTNFTPLKGMVEDHIRFSGTATTLLISFGKSPEIGLAVLYAIQQRSGLREAYGGEGKFPVLYEVTLDKIDLIGRYQYEAIGRDAPTGNYEFALPDGRTITGKADNDMETLVMCCVTPDRLRAVGHPLVEILKKKNK